ncbi:MAG: glycosyltransferase [Bacteroidales bacterium]|nr:glycosyltransferase [Bacteroidales bacterium]
MTPLVSIVVPFYNVEAYIGQCAESLLGQTYPSIEFIFVNDGTQDRSREVLADVIARYPGRNVQIVDKANGGLPQARKTGIGLCTGEYVLNVDSDDWLEPDAVEKLVAEAEKSKADVVYFFAWKEFGGGRSRVITDKVYSSPQAFAEAIFAHKAHAALWLKFWRRSLYRPEIFFPFHGLHEDMVQAVQLLDRASSLVRLPEPLYHYRCDNSGAMTKKSRASRRRQSMRNLLDLYSYYKDALEASPLRRFHRRLLGKARWWAMLYDRSVFKEYPFL